MPVAGFYAAAVFNWNNIYEFVFWGLIAGYSGLALALVYFKAFYCGLFSL